MNDVELKAVFDQLASGYDRLSAKLAPINRGLHYLLESVFADLPFEAQVLCVGVGTGEELIYLANRFPRWHFTVVEPSGAMLNICRHRAEEARITSRCYFHEGYLDSLPTKNAYDAATCFLVSQFILDQETRSDFFHKIAIRLKSKGILASSDLSAEVGSEGYEALISLWRNVMISSDTSSEGLSRMKATYAKDVAVLSPAVVATIIQSGGFEMPTQFFQAGLIHAWFAKRASSNAI